MDGEEITEGIRIETVEAARSLAPRGVDLVQNPRARAGSGYPAALTAILSSGRFAAAAAEITAWPGYRPTPLRPLPGLAAALKIAAIGYKDEAPRYGLGSFKALGGAYAVLRHLQRTIAARTGLAPASAALRAGDHAALSRDLTVCSATDGNHGRSVAWGAQQFGCRAVIYIHAGVSEGRRDAIARFGAEVVRHSGTYDDAVRRCAEDARTHGWTVVSDTSWPGYEEIPRDVMDGYGVMAAEALNQWGEASPPTHVFLQGGVGGMAAAVIAAIWLQLGAGRPAFILVEPETAACLSESARAGRRVDVAIAVETVMAGLSCGEASLLAWPVLEAGGDAFMTIPDALAEALMRDLAAGSAGDPPLVAGESAVAGLAGLIAALAREDWRVALGLDAASRVLVFGTEGATDPEVYARIVGRPAEAVARTAAAAAGGS